MNEEIQRQIATGIKLLQEGTYTTQDLQAHIEQIVKDNDNANSIHKDQLERMLYKTEELIQEQAKFFGGDRSVLSNCKKLEKELWHKIQYLIGHGYSIERFKQKQPTQQKLL